MGVSYSRWQSTVEPRLPASSYEELFLKLEAKRVERDIAMRQAIAERNAALQIAESREALKWSAPTGLLTAVVSIASAWKHKNVLHIIPVFPIIGYLSYETHNCYGNKRETIIDESEKIFAESGPFLVPQPISTAEVQERIDQIREI